jgi:hypothetical protein
MEWKDMLMYALYAALVVVFGIGGWYIGEHYMDNNGMVGAAVGALVGAGASAGLYYYNKA